MIASVISPTLAGQSVMPSLHLACDELTISVRSPYDIVRFFGRRRVAAASPILFNSELYQKIKIVKPVSH